jgi:hypothetical protein
MKWPQRASHGMRQVGWLKREMAGENSLVPYAPRRVRTIKSVILLLNSPLNTSVSNLVDS